MSICLNGYFNNMVRSCAICCIEMTTPNYSFRQNYPTEQKYSSELIFAKFATVKIAKDLYPLKISPDRC